MKRPLLAIVAAILLGVPVWGQEAKAPVRVEKDLVYGKGGDTEMKLDLAMPKNGDGPYPALVYVHGGAWRSGKRQDLGTAIEQVAQQGYVAVTVSYRLIPTKFPAQIEDCKAAVRWLRANAKKYKVDPNRIGAVGFSAGGHLVDLLGLTAKSDGLEGKGGNDEQSSAVQAVVSFFGPTDFTVKTWDPNIETKLLAPFLGGTFDEKPELYKRVSPITYVRKDAPPFLLFHGTEDKIVNVKQSRILAEKLKAAGASVKLVELEGEGHGWGGAKLTQTIEQTMKFFDENLKKGKK